jgi:hypothetical protein
MHVLPGLYIAVSLLRMCSLMRIREHSYSQKGLYITVSLCVYRTGGFSIEKTYKGHSPEPPTLVVHYGISVCVCMHACMYTYTILAAYALHVCIHILF